MLDIIPVYKKLKKQKIYKHPVEETYFLEPSEFIINNKLTHVIFLVPMFSKDFKYSLQGKFHRNGKTFRQVQSKYRGKEITYCCFKQDLDKIEDLKTKEEILKFIDKII